jgi:hypothetical protein
MASDFKLGVTARNAAVDAVLALDTGPGGEGMSLQLFTGSPPISPADADSGSLIMGWGFDAAIYGSAANGAASLLAPITEAIFSTAIPGHFRMKGTPGVIFQGTCGDASDAPVDMQFDRKDLYNGGEVQLTALTLTLPES